MNKMFLASSSTSAGSSGYTMIIVMVALVALMYFLMIRPQKKEQKRLQAMLSSMQIGDAVITTSGFYGFIIDMTDEDVIVEFGNNKNCRIPMRKQAIAQVEKPVVAASQAKEEEKKEEKKEEK